MTNGKIFNIDIHHKTVLVAPLDWGLGHATRCIPIIKQLQSQNNQVLIAASGSTQKILKQEFPNLRFVPLQGYNIKYAKKASCLPFKILAQLPTILSCIKRENMWLKELVSKEKIDVVISDNRPGLYHKEIHSVYITHQLIIYATYKWLRNILQRLHYKYINKFNECWVPDYEGTNNLAGLLSHPEKMPAVPVTYIGPLSRFVYSTEEIKYKLLVVLSGPEPQRTILENKLIEELKNYNHQALFVRGVFDSSELTPFNNVIFKNNLPSSALNKAFLQAEKIICRSGYSTIMDLAAVSKTATLIPTPGQTEQEYLGSYLMKKELFMCVKQKDFSLAKI